jgi:dephospho-CoA kinase
MYVGVCFARRNAVRRWHNGVALAAASHRTQCLFPGSAKRGAMSVIGFVGLPGSGKSEAAAVASDLGIPVVTMGDVIRAECRDRGLDPATEHGRVATALREENGPAAIAERSLPLIEAELEDSDTVVVDGIRSAVEVEEFEAAFGEEFSLVSIEAPFETRRERLDLRGRDAGSEEGGESLEDRDARELDFGMGEAMERADRTVENTDTLDAFQDRIKTILSDR